jgi:predicted PurR-regulated permease PerM
VPPNADAAPAQRNVTRLLAVIAAILVVAALKISAPVTLPLVVAAFLLVLTHPLREWLRRRMAGWLAVVLTTLAVLVVAAIIASGFGLAIGSIAERAPEIGERLTELTTRLREWGEARGLPMPGGGDSARSSQPQGGSGEGGTGGGQSGGAGGGHIDRIVRQGLSTIEMLGLVFAFFILGLLEVRDFEVKAARRLPGGTGRSVVENAGAISARVRRYLLALSASSVVSGIATGLFTWAMGLDSPLTWGLVAFLLNYIPTIGPFVAVIPPSLYAIVQFDSPLRAAAVFFGVGAIQFFVGNFLDPKIEGRALSLSPLVVLVAVIFWGWVWGVFGALLGVPLTVALVMIADQFDSTRWIASLLTEVERRKKPR